MEPVVKHMIKSVKAVLQNFFSSDMNVISNEAKEILADTENSKIYFEGISQLRLQEKQGNDSPTVTIKLKNDKEITLTR